MLTRDQLLYIYSQGPEAMIAVIEAMMAGMEAMRKQVEELEKKVEELENEKAKNSRNSGKPPTSDGLKKVVKSLREKSGKKAGGQVGHKGKGMERVAEADEVVVYGVEECGHCGEDLREEAVRRVERRQVVEVPEVKVKVVEHQGEHKRCPKCGKESVGKFPAGVENVVQYGPRVKATAVYLVQEQHVPVGRTKQTLKDLLGCEMSAGSVMNAVRECSERVKPEVERIKEEIREAAVGDFDETGLRVMKGLMWLHVAGTVELTYYEVQAGRGIKAIEAIDILPKFEGVAVHDAYAAYLAYDGKHALCNAHLLRELIFVAEQLKQAWATELIKLVLEIKARVAEAVAAGLTELPAQQIADFEIRYADCLLAGFALPVNAPPPPTGRRPKQSVSKNLLDRLLIHQPLVLAFLYDFQIPFDNNLAERDLRMMKLKQKISGCFRSLAGAQDFAVIRSYLSSLKKQGRDVFSALCSIFAGHPVSPLPLSPAWL